MGGRGASSSIKSKETNSKSKQSNKKEGYVVINQMIKDDFTKLKQQIKEHNEKYNELFHKWYDMRRDNRPDLSDEEYSKAKKEAYNDLQRFQYDNRGIARLTEMSDERLEKAIKDHYDDLQAKVEKKIGKIKYITKTGNNGYDYRMENAKGESVAVEVIGAGGYNVQRYHTRWIIKK